MDKVLITGAGGFIGSHLTDDQLARGRYVKAMDIHLGRLAHLRQEKRCELLNGDIRDDIFLKKAVEEVDCIFHLASAHLEVNKPESYYWETNVKALRKFVEIAQNANVKRFIHCSSVGVFGNLEKLPANENSPCNPDILYEKTKLAGENEVLDFARNNKMPIVVLRPAWVYGPGCPRTLKLFRTIKKRRFFMVGDGSNYRHPIYITDMVEAFELAAQREKVSGEIFIVAGAQAVPLKKLVTEIAEVQDVKLPPVKMPLSVMKMLCLMTEKFFDTLKKEPPFSTRSLKFFTESSSFDISKAKKKLDFQAKIDLELGLKQTYDWFQKQGLL